jgi:hypothetical protein
MKWIKTLPGVNAHVLKPVLNNTSSVTNMKKHCTKLEKKKKSIARSKGKGKKLTSAEESLSQTKSRFE